jgi:hypothetical protein
VLQGRQKGVLNQILRVFTMPKNSHRERHRPREVPIHDLTERVPLAGPNEGEKLSVLIGIIVRAKHEWCAWTVLPTCRSRVRIPHLDFGARWCCSKGCTAKSL